MGWVGVGVEVGLGLGWGRVGVKLELGIGWVWVGLISSFPKRFYNPSGRVAGWVGGEVRLYNHSSAQPIGFSHRSECGNIFPHQL